MNYYMFPKTIVRNTLLSNAEQYGISYEVRLIATERSVQVITACNLSTNCFPQTLFRK